jgi:hypothetical protein
MPDFGGNCACGYGKLSSARSKVRIKEMGPQEKSLSCGTVAALVVMAGAIIAIVGCETKHQETSNLSAAPMTSSGQSDAKFVAPSPFTLARDGYVVKGSSHSFSDAEIDIELAVVFRKRPTLEKAYSILSLEVAGYVRQIGGPPKVEILSHAFVGDPEKDSSSWEQIKDTGHTYYVQVWFDARSNSIMKGRLDEGESIVSNVLAGAQAAKASAVAKAGDEERAKKHENNKLTTAVAGAQQLLRHLRDPESLKIVSVVVTDKNGMACIEYRARNGFGGVNRERAVYILLALITESDKGFVTAWNRWCANMSGTEEGPYVSVLIDQGVIK